MLAPPPPMPPNKALSSQNYKTIYQLVPNGSLLSPATPHPPAWFFSQTLPGRSPASPAKWIKDHGFIPYLISTHLAATHTATFLRGTWFFHHPSRWKPRLTLGWKCCDRCRGGREVALPMSAIHTGSLGSQYSCATPPPNACPFLPLTPQATTTRRQGYMLGGRSCLLCGLCLIEMCFWGKKQVSKGGTGQVRCWDLWQRSELAFLLLIILYWPKWIISHSQQYFRYIVTL